MTTLTRSITVTEVSEDLREFTGVFAPYDEVITFNGNQEQYARGLFNELDDAERIPIHYEHDINHGALPVGRVLEITDSETGAVVRGKFFDSDRGREVYQILKSDNGFRGLSANFIPTQMRVEGDVTVYEKAALLEVSVVARGAYPSALISEVRSDPDNTNNTKEVSQEDTENMTNENVIDSEARSGLADLERRVEVLVNKEDNAPAVASNIRSYGEYVQGIAKGDESAQSLYRAWTGGTSADNTVFPAFVADLTREVEDARKIYNLFDRGQFPAQGNVFEYLKEKSDTLQVGKQPAEGELLPYGKIAFEKASGNIDTYGGWTSLTRQEIERGNVNVVDRAFRRLATRYAQATDAAVKAQILAAAKHEVVGDITGFDGWLDFVIDASAHLQAKGLEAEFIIASPDVYKEAAKMREGANGGYLLGRDSGAINPRGLSGTILGLPIVLTPGADVAIIGHSSAVLTLENGGPAQLTDSDITNLTGQLSVYGYMGSAVVDPDALVVVEAV